MTEPVDYLETWMTQLPNSLREIPIIYLAIPGTHDSMSYGIRSNAQVAPDAEPAVAKLYKVMPCVVRRWAITQRLNAVQQLVYGIRFFDLRMSMNAKDNRFYFVHGLFCEEITKPLQRIRDYLDEHPGEFIIFDCQHFYDFNDDDYERFENILRAIFLNRFYTRNDGHLEDLTLNRAHSMKRQLLVVYRRAQVPKEFWPSDAWPTPWPNQIKVNKLEAYLNSMIAHRSPHAGYVSQCVLTPPVGFIVPRFYSSLRDKCAWQVIKGLTGWIKQQRPGPFSSNAPTCNVFIADFVELNNFEFCQVVVQLNYKIAINSCNTINVDCNGDDEKDNEI